MYFVYVLKSQKDKKLYYGLTDSLERRVSDHNKGSVPSTKARRPFDLMYYEVVETVQEAQKREKYFKTGFGRKYIKNKINNGPIV